MVNNKAIISKQDLNYLTCFEKQINPQEHRIALMIQENKIKTRITSFLLRIIQNGSSFVRRLSFHSHVASTAWSVLQATKYYRKLRKLC